MLSNIKDNQYVFFAADKASSWPRAIKCVLVEAKQSKRKYILNSNHFTLYIYFVIILFYTVFGVPLQLLIERDKSPIPLIVQHSVQHLLTRGASVKGLFVELGPLDEFDEIRNYIDQEETFNQKILNETSIHNIANLLLLWLRELPEPLLTFKAYQEIINARSNFLLIFYFCKLKF